MKNQNDMIITIVAVVLALIVTTVLAFTGPKSDNPANPEVVNLDAPKIQGADVKFANSLPGGSTSSGGPGGQRAAGPGGAGGSGNTVPFNQRGPMAAGTAGGGGG